MRPLEKVKIGVNLGRWYKIAIKILKGENWLSSLMWSNDLKNIKDNLDNKKFLYRNPNFKWE
ncbi:hypothetical protein [Helicobacter vulpis]|uniref:hypothetical protein n=1 Tax=Helicobacter vulpis TaxID=2316076 RepID=UPI000EB3DDBF|nr:hypothetical protein [Helicobacter vulpis]